MDKFKEGVKMECSCSIDTCCDEGYEESEQKIILFDSDLIMIECGECGRSIKKGEKYEWYRGEYEGEKHTHHTCLDCISLRENFFSGWIFESTWEDFRNNMDNCGWQVPEKCLSKCTPATRETICKYIETYWEE